jgi:hypothetical protein
MTKTKRPSAAHKQWVESLAHIILEAEKLSPDGRVNYVVALAAAALAQLGMFTKGNAAERKRVAKALKTLIQGTLPEVLAK